MENNKEVSSKIIAGLVTNQRKAVVKTLAKNGVVLKRPEDDTELLTAVYTGFARSKAFRNDLTALAKEGDYSNYVDEQFFNADSGTGGTKVGNFLRDVFTPERTNQLVDTGFNLLNQKLAASANKGSEQRAIQYEVQRTQTAMAEAAAAEQKRLASQEKNKWVVPAVIGGLIIAGIAVYFIVKKKK